MRELLKHTKDTYEQNYGAKICEKFDGYAIFWNKYIGQRNDNRLKHYEIDSSNAHIDRFDQKYENMAFAHYGIFRDLVSVRLSFGRVSGNQYETTLDKLLYWNDVKNIYSAMGNSIYKYGCFLDYVKDILNVGKLIDDIFPDLQKELEIIKNKRDYISHFTEIPYSELEGRKMPLKIRDDKQKFIPFSEIVNQDQQDWIEVELQIQNDLNEIEEVFNKNHKVVLELFERYKKFEIIDPGPINDIESERGVYYPILSSSTIVPKHEFKKENGIMKSGDSSG